MSTETPSPRSQATPAIGYIVSHEAWYHTPDREPEITIGDYVGDGCTWEFGVRKRGNIGVRVEMFDDAWTAFSVIPELFSRLAALPSGTTLDQVQAILDTLGYRDMTERRNPNHAADKTAGVDAKLRTAVQHVIGDVDDATWLKLRETITAV